MNEGGGRQLFDLVSKTRFTMQSGVTWERGPKGRIIACDGTANGHAAAATALRRPGVRYMTFAALTYIQQSADLTEFDAFIGWRDGSNPDTHALLVRANTGAFRLGYMANGDRWQYIDGPPLVYGRWAWLIASITPGRTTLYVDTTTATDPSGPASVDFSTSLYIGKDNYGPGNREPKAKYAAVYVWIGRALTTPEVHLLVKEPYAPIRAPDPMVLVGTTPGANFSRSFSSTIAHSSTVAGVAFTPPSWKASGALVGSTGADITPVIPAHVADNVLVLQTAARSNAVTVATPAGWSLIVGPIDQGTTWRTYWFWKRAASASETNPLCDWSGTTGDKYATVHVYQNTIATGTPYEASAATAGTADPGEATGVTSLTDQALIASMGMSADNVATSVVVAGTNPAQLPTHDYDTVVTGADAGRWVSSAVKQNGGATGNISHDFSGNPLQWSVLVLAFKPIVTAPNFPRAISSTIGSTVSLTRLLALARTASQTTPHSTAIERAVANTRTLSSTTAHTSSASRSKAWLRLRSSTIAHSAVVDRTVAATRVFSSTVAHSSAVSSLVAFVRAVASTIAHTSEAARSISGGGGADFPRSFSSTIAHSAVFARSVVLARSFSSTIAHSSAVARATAVVRALAQTVAHSTATTRGVALTRALSSTAAHTSAVARSILGGAADYPRSFSSTIAHSAVIVRTLAATRTIVQYVHAPSTLTNPDFATDVSTVSAFNWTSGGASWLSSDGHDANGSLRASGAATQFNSTLSNSDSKAAVAGQRWRAGFWVKNNGGPSSGVYIAVQSLGSSFGETQTNITLTGSWQYVEAEHVVSAGDTSVIWKIGFTVSNTYDFLIDDITLVNLSGGISSSATFLSGKLRAISSTVAHSSVAARSAGLVRTLASTVAHSSAAMRVAARVRTITATRAITTAVTRQVGFARTLSRTTTHTVSLVRLVVQGRALSSTIAHVSTAARTGSFGRGFSSTIAVASAATRVFAVLATVWYKLRAHVGSGRREASPTGGAATRSRTPPPGVGRYRR